MKVDIPKNGKSKIKIHSWDTWSMDHTLAQIIWPMLKQIKAQSGGIPGKIIGELYPDRLDHTQEEMQIAEKKWHEILDKMIWSMEHIACPDLYPERKRLKGQTRKNQDKRNNEILFNGAKETKEEIDSLEKWREEMEIYQKKKQEGCELFGKYFQNLWT